MLSKHTSEYNRFRKPTSKVTADGRHNLLAQSLNLKPGESGALYERPRTQMLSSAQGYRRKASA